MTNNNDLLAAAVTLEDCPPGPFLFDGSLGFKTEYRATLPDGPTNIPGDQVRWKVSQWPDAYCMESGEFFWGGAKTHEERAKLLVTPIDPARLRSAISSAEEQAGEVKAERDALSETVSRQEAHIQSSDAEVVRLRERVAQLEGALAACRFEPTWENPDGPTAA